MVEKKVLFQIVQFYTLSFFKKLYSITIWQLLFLCLSAFSFHIYKLFVAVDKKINLISMGFGSSDNSTYCDNVENEIKEEKLWT